MVPPDFSGDGFLAILLQENETFKNTTEHQLRCRLTWKLSVSSVVHAESIQLGATLHKFYARSSTTLGHSKSS